MARPTKQGVDYFPFDVHLDNKFKFIEIKFGLEGFAVVVKMLQEIYSQGYFSKWGDDEILLFSNEHNVEFDKIVEITNECLARNIFNSTLYEEYGILTSRGIQSRYKEIVRRRKDVNVTDEYLLIDGPFGVNDNAMTTSSRQSDGKSTQSKVKETKVNKSKEKEIKEENKVPYKEIVSYLNEKVSKHFRHTTPKTKDLIKYRFNEGFTLDDFKKVIDIKTDEWINDDKMKKFLRPETLFGTKFEGYLNQDTTSDDNPFKYNPEVDSF